MQPNDRPWFHTHPAREQYVSYGHTLLASPSGQVISSPTPTGEGETIVFARLEPDVMRAARQALPLWCSARPDVYRR
jgi:predicted amidohydrolase